MFTIQSNSIQTIKENIIQLQELNGNGHYIANDYSLFIIITLTGQY